MPANKLLKSRYYSFDAVTRQYMKFLGAQGVALPGYGTLLSWNQFMMTYGALPPRNLAAFYPADPTAIYLDSAGAVQLWEDRSGNSATPCLVLDGTAGNNATSPDSVPLSIVGDIDVRAQIAANDWTPSATQAILSKRGNLGNVSWQFILNTDGTIQFSWSEDGTAILNAVSTAAPSVTDLSVLWVRATLDVDNGAAGRTVTFYTSTNGVTWTQLGNLVTTAGVTSIFDSTITLGIGVINVSSNSFAGRVYRAQVYAGLTGTDLRFDANFALAAKLATAFVESSSNAATVTVNTSGATGARVCGERDLYQGTAANRPAYTGPGIGARLSVTFDGTNDYLKAAAFSLSQPATVYSVLRQISWTNGEYIFDGNDATHRMVLEQFSGTPLLYIYAGTSDVAPNGDAILGSNVVISTVFNGSLSWLRINRGTASTGSPGAQGGGGFTLGASNSGGSPSNFVASEFAIYSDAHDVVTAAQIVTTLASRNSIPL